MSGSARAACDVGSTVGCADGQICMDGSPAPACVPIPATAPLSDLVLPFDAETEAVCTHGSGGGSHGWPNAFYALDLATPYEKPAAIVRAAADGKAFVFLGEDGQPCAQPAGSPSSSVTDGCGDGWGNRVKVLHSGGYYTFYVHLREVWVKSGDLVKQGQPLGVEGWTGLAGHRHLHWSVQKLPGTTPQDWESHIDWTGDSVPFNFVARMGGEIRVVNSPDLACPHANIGQAADQPRLSGVH